VNSIGPSDDDYQMLQRLKNFCGLQKQDLMQALWKNIRNKDI